MENQPVISSNDKPDSQTTDCQASSSNTQDRDVVQGSDESQWQLPEASRPPVPTEYNKRQATDQREAEQHVNEWS